MLSIIICSRTKEINKNLNENIDESIGCVYELIIIDNSQNLYSIFEAYNLGIKKSNGKYLCFIHDDILFHTKKWGKIVSQIFECNETIGLLGLVGAKIKTKMPSGYWNCPKEFRKINIIQHLSDGKIEKVEYGFETGSVSEVVAIDGVFMVIKKEHNFFFNEKLVGFHNYDLNISFECIKRGFKIFVTSEVVIEHHSNGIINKSWYESNYKVHQIYKEILPLKTSDVIGFDILPLEFCNGMTFLNPFIKTGNLVMSFRIWLTLFLRRPNAVFKLKFLKSMIKTFFKIKNT